MYKTSQLRKDRFKKFGIYKSDPSLTELPSSPAELKSHSSVNLISSTHSSTTCDSVQEYIENSRDCLGLTTVPLQHPSEADIKTESLLASSGPITGVRDLKTFSRRRLELSSPVSRDMSVQFVYALTRPNNKGCSVYDMYITSAEKARAQKQYYTISAFNVSEVR